MKMNFSCCSGSDTPTDSPLTDTYRRQEGEEVVLLVVDDVPGVPLLPLLWVAQPHGAGTEVSHATAAGPRAAPETHRRGT